MAPTNAELFRFLQAWVTGTYCGEVGAELTLTLASGRIVNLPLDPPKLETVTQKAERFVPTAIQAIILDSLDGVAMKSTQLMLKVRNKSQLYQHPGGMKELIEHKLVAQHKRLGYYRPDSPPPELADDEGGTP